MGETRVDLLHLLEDLRDAYPGPAEETILTEIVANALDSGAATIAITADPADGTLALVDDGRGMRRRELAHYHDIAATTKVRGEGIGFAGVGIKVALLLCRAVLTETRQGQRHVATAWALASRHRAPWRWVPPPGLVGARGTAVRLTLDNALSPLLDPGFIEAVLRRQFQPLFDPAFAEILAAHYPAGVRFVLNGARLDPEGWAATESAPMAVRLARRRKPSAAGYLLREPEPLPEERRGIAISTFGKVIKRGWDWLGLTPAAPDRVGGLIEAPPLAECLTLNKADFIRSGARGAAYLAYRRVIQQAVSAQLALWGDGTEGGERGHRRAARPAERDLESVLADLADSFPLLASLVEHRAGGQRRLPIRGPARGEAAGSGAAQAPLQPVLAAAGPPPAAPEPTAAAPGSAEPPAGPAPPEALPPERHPGPAPGERGLRRPGRYGLGIQFEERPGDPEMGRLVESTVWVNEAHPAYRRAAASRSEGYHIALASALALAPLAVEPAKEHAFVTAFLTSWGAALDRRRAGARRARRS
ncbi:MAG: ATP-binding protein [Candidatus Rokubacteria bacterium]|nr:ATP-binding protein [Candidatus Rokubacteria bacterium]